MRINVTQEDIDYGKSGDVQFCPVSLAIKRQIKGATIVCSSQLRLYVMGERRKLLFFKSFFHFILPTPKAVATFITNYDAFPLEPNRNLFKPFSFELDLNNA